MGVRARQGRESAASMKSIGSVPRATATAVATIFRICCNMCCVRDPCPQQRSTWKRGDGRWWKRISGKYLASRLVEHEALSGHFQRHEAGRVGVGRVEPPGRLHRE